MNQEEFIRDICKVTPMSKSEARNSLNLIIAQALAEERERVVMEIRKRMPSHDAVMEYLSSLDNPLTDKE